MKVMPRKWLKRLAGPSVMSFSALWLIVLVVVGTLEQKSIGLYLAQERYFSSWFFMSWDWLPLPGGHLVMAVMTTGLLVKLTMFSKWKIRNLGVNIIHMGAVILLGGGVVTAYFSSEGNMSIPEGGRKSYCEDNYKVELALTQELKDGRNEVIIFPGSSITSGEELRHPKLPFNITVKQFLRNVGAEARAGQAPEKSQGFARNFLLKAESLDTDYEQNRAGVELDVVGLDAQNDGFYQTMEFMPVDQFLRNENGDRWKIELRRKRIRLPFEIELIDFRKEVYAGTARARSYQSEVKLIEGDSERRVLIHMNHPLRHKGYTLYQSSFIENGDGQTTVLAVVHNQGRLFPYISCSIICFGLIFHLGAHAYRAKMRNFS